MRNWKTKLAGLASAAAAACLLALGATPAFAASTTVESVPGDVIVAYTASTEDPGTMRARSVLGAYGVTDSEDLGLSLDGAGDVVRLTLADDSNVDALIDQLNGTDGVLFAQRNYRYGLIDGWKAAPAAVGINLLPEALTPADLHITPLAAAPMEATTDDPYLSKQWYLGTWEESNGANVLNAWNTAKAANSVTVAVLDTGVRSTHKDLVDNLDLEHAKDVYRNSPAGSIADYVGHGTHVCGIVAASANNGVGIAGASYNANVLPIKVFNDVAGDNAYTETAWLIRAYSYLQHLVAAGEVPNLHVINMSLGGYGQQNSDDVALRSAIKTLRDDYQVLTVVAGGNGDDYGNPFIENSWPSDFEECFAVTALDTNGGNAAWSDYNAEKDISAPGVSIYSTYISNDNSYTNMSGTSMASPLVAGIASLLWVANPDLTVDKAVEAMQSTANDVRRDSNYHEESGSAGAIDAEKAVQHVLNGSAGEYVGLGNVDFTMDEAVLWTGKAVEPKVVGVYDGVQLVEGVDFSVSYSSNVKVGTGRAVITGMGKYRGVVRKSFRICYDLADGTAWVPNIPAQSYTGEALQPEVKVYHGSRLLKEGRDYSVAYFDNVVGPLATVKITGEGSYMNSFEASFAIEGVPARYGIKRIAGESAGDTAAAISSEAFVRSDTVILARDDDFADAMSATGLAGALNCPIVLTDRHALSEVAASEIARLGAKTVYVIGGTGAMPDDFEGKLKAQGVPTVKRLFGEESWDTSVACAKMIAANGGGNDAIVAMSGNFQDALSISSFAYKYKLPIFLETDEGDRPLPQDAIDAIAAMPGNIYVPGGPAAVKPATVEETFAGRMVVRMFGEDGFDTSNQVATKLVSLGLMSADTVCIASGREEAKGVDALAGSALAGSNGGVILLVDGTNADPLFETTTITGPDSNGDAGFLTSHASAVSNAFVLGGQAVVPQGMVDLVDSVLAKA